MNLRLLNEGATVLLFAIVFIVVLKDMMNWLYGLAGLIAFSLLLLAAIKIYKDVRKKRS
jgi:putative membrane protein